MAMVDYDYKGEIFDFDDAFYAEDIENQNWEVRFDADKIHGKIMIIYIDIFDNEKREVKKIGSSGFLMGKPRELLLSESLYGARR